MLAQTYPGIRDSISWEQLKNEPVSEKSFRATCDLMQHIAKTDMDRSYKIFTAYLPKVKASGIHRWVHILLMAWARARESLNYFADAENLFRQARENAMNDPALYRESLVGTILLYLEWNKKDSLNKYLSMSEAACLTARDSENLSFAYTFKAMSQLNKADTMAYYLDRAISLAKNLPDKNALFTARYNYAVMYCQNNPQKEVEELDTLLQLAKDSSLNHYPPKLYERSNFSFRNSGPSIYYNLMQVNLLLTDYDNAEKFAQLFYDATITPHPNGVQAPYFNAEMAIVKAYNNEYDSAQKYLNKSREQFKMPENKIPYISYFIAAGMLQEHHKNYEQSLQYYKAALQKGNTEGLYLMPPEIYYAHALTLTKNWEKASQTFSGIQAHLQKNKYTAGGFYYYKYYAELLKAKNDYPASANALETFYEIKDSLTSLNRYRAIKEVETRFQVKQEQQQIANLQHENNIRKMQNRRERNFYITLINLAVLSILLLIVNIYQRKIRSRQKEALQQSRIKQVEEQHRISIMQQVMEAEESERRKIADQLHDDVGSMLSLASVNISSTLEKNGEDEAAEAKLNKAHEILSSVSVTIRDLSHQLTPLAIEKYGFRKAVEDLAYTINLSEKITLELIIIGLEDASGYPVIFLHNLYRIIQELLHNIIKHAHATHAMLELVEHTQYISLIVEDNGAGIPTTSTKGKGLNNIQSKIAYLEGRMEITGNEKSGTLIVIEIPLNQFK